MKILALPVLLSAFILSTALAEDKAPFDQTLELQGISFRVQSTPGRVVITPTGLKIDNSVRTREIAGEVVRAEIADLNSDGSPEIYVYVRKPGAEQRMELIAYSANRRKSLSDIFLPELPPKYAKGYVGPEDMAVVEGTFCRRFAIKGGKTRQLQYKLKAGEAGWRLRLDRALVF